MDDDTETKLGVAANWGTRRLTMTMTSRNEHLGSVSFDLSSTGKVAATLLEAAVIAHQESGRPPPYPTKDDPFEAGFAPCSGWAIAPGSTPEMLNVVFFFGEAALAIPVRRENAVALGHRLVLAGSSSGSRQ